MLSLCYLNPAEGRTYGFPGIPSFGISVLLTVADSTKYLRYFYPHPYYIFNNLRYGMKMNLIRPVHRFKLRQPPPLSLARLFRSSPSSMIRSFKKKEEDIRRVLPPLWQVKIDARIRQDHLCKLKYVCTQVFGIKRS